MIAPDGSGGFTVAWMSWFQDGSATSVYARRFDAEGAPLSGEIPVNTTTASSQRTPAITPDPARRFHRRLAELRTGRLGLRRLRAAL